MNNKHFPSPATLPEKLSIRLIAYLLIALTLSGCESTEDTSAQANPTETNQAPAPEITVQDIRNRVSQYAATYAMRDDFELFIGFYHENARLEDIINGDVKQGKAEIRNFFDWSNSNFSLGDSAVTLNVEQVVVEGKVAVIKGYFLPFTFHGLPLGPWHFTTWLTFNDDLLITKQVDVINYTPRTLFKGKANSNRWIEIPSYLIDKKQTSN